jgi:hypothetical protein
MTRPLTAARNLAAKAWRHGSAVSKRSVRFAGPMRLWEQLNMLQEGWSIERDLAVLARGRRPIIAGPWLSEVGFEVLYWIPFLRWLEDRYRIDRERVIAVSRGGVSSWYEDVASTYVEIFDHLDPDAFTRRNAERRDADEAGGQKQTQHGALDTEVLQRVRRTVGADDAAICHPQLMYRLFYQFWSGNRPLDLVTSHTRHRLLSVPRPTYLPLPERYVAVKFYTGAALPDTPDHRHVLRDLVSGAALHVPVVVLDTGLRTDDHDDYLFGGLPNVFSLRSHLTAQTNLGTQTAVIAGAQGFIGTCGSLAWLAPMLGVQTVAIYANDRFLLSHMFFATHVYRQHRAADFDALDLRGAMQLNLLTARETVGATCRPQPRA